ncbi:hypothetical protein Glove_426g14 [Diversispora epigaea]|uniref:Uncharacterized protein n=1 Tax=Diversispora epigaea TaxID=1348612 RepID=A0A397GYL7_9GLOM|nr:hypothetical protein Glove_426g14 [Diversispora epigaea]
MSAIVTKIVEKYNLGSKTDPSELGQYTSEFLKNLTDDRKRSQARRRLRDSFKFSSEQNRYGFSEDQINALFSIQENGSKIVNVAISNKPSKGVAEETIGDMAQQILRDKLSIRDVKVKAYALALSASNANAGSSRLSRLRRELKTLGASLQIIEVTKFPDITEDANKIQMDNRKKAKTIDYPDEFTLESVKKRLDAYDLKTPPNYQTLADIMVMLYIRPAELTTLRITDAGNAISSGQMGDLSKPGAKWFNKFLKGYDLVPKYLRKLGAVYAVITNRAKNMAHAYTIAEEALRHNFDNHTSPVQNYVVVNYQRKNQTPGKATKEDIDCIMYARDLKDSYSYANSIGEPNLPEWYIKNTKISPDPAQCELTKSQEIDISEEPKPDPIEVKRKRKTTEIENIARRLLRSELEKLVIEE